MSCQPLPLSPAPAFQEPASLGPCVSNSVVTHTQLPASQLPFASAQPNQQQSSVVCQVPINSTNAPDFRQLAQQNGGIPQVNAPGIEIELFEYLNGGLSPDHILSETAIQQLVSRACPRPLNLNVIPDGKSMPLLHLVVLNTVTPAPALENIASKLIQLGAAPEAQDDDGDTALEVLLGLAKEYIEDGEPLSESILSAQLGTMCVLLGSKSLKVDQKNVKQVCRWLRHFSPTNGHGRQRVLNVLAKHAGDDEVFSTWCSEQLLAYLDYEAYDGKRSIEAPRVLCFLEQGASPCHSQGGATALLLVVFNPYCNYEELLLIFRAMLEKDPHCAAMRDGFKLLPMQWAADYRGVALQHNLSQPNPASLLALLPSIVEKVPADVDAGEICVKSRTTERTCAQVNIISDQQLRFTVGDGVLCRVQVPGREYDWEEGIVVGLWYREDCWPENHPGAPYEVRLLIGTCVYALVDHDRIIRSIKANRDMPTPQHSKETKDARFRRRQRDDGSWELLDTVSGKSRPVLSDSEDD